jgi:hypothetical protein
LRHHFIERDDVLLRMLPRFGRAASVSASFRETASLKRAD